MEKIFKSYINSIKPYEPGKPIEEVQREYGLKKVIKLASNENPLGTSKKVIKEIQRAASQVHLYPDGGTYYLGRTLASKLGVSEKEIIFGNGSNEILELLIKGFLVPGDKVISSSLSFLVYPLATQVAGGRFEEVPIKNYRFDLERMAELVDKSTKLVFIANPNNPTGTYVTKQELNDFLDRVPENVIVCIDEAYVDFVDAKDFPDTLSYVRQERPNVIVARTFSKSHGLAGLRIGYGVACPELIQYLHKIRQPFNVNLIAQRAAIAALNDTAYTVKTRSVVLEGRDYFCKQFKKMGLDYVSSQANFVLVDVGHDAESIFKALLTKGVIVRSMKAYGLKTHVRVSVGLPEENQIFIGELKKLLKRAKNGKSLLV